MSTPTLPACCIPSEDASVAERLYCAYNRGGPADRAGLTWDGREVPPWSTLPDTSPVRAKWEAVVEEAARERGGSDGAT